MAKTATVRRATALPVIPSCLECHWFADCGGLRDNQRELFGDSCFARYCCGGKQGCNYLCLRNPRFAAMMNEVESLNFAGLPELVHRGVDLPRYVPSILHASSRELPLKIPFAAVPVELIFRTKGGHMRAVAKTAAELRHKLKLGARTRVIVNCIRQDEALERLWEFWRQDDIPAQLAMLGIHLVIGPNFSHLRGVPRLESIGNRMRHLMCIRDCARAGLLAVPHLSVIDPADWDWWTDYLKRNRRVRYIAFEFETGYKDRIEGEDAILRLAQLQQALDRNLHLIVVGGTQYRVLVRRHFQVCSFIDGSPFWNTISRQRGRREGEEITWNQCPLPREAPLDDLMAHNVPTYTKWFTACFGED
jgi:hypothetical protein